MNSDVDKIRSKMTREEMAATVAELVKPAIAEAIYGATRTCLTCDYFDQAKELCNKYGGRPPAKVIAFGCDGYENEIPF